ncbi:MAG: DNA methyltransferase, partial [Smithella sp.]
FPIIAPDGKPVMPRRQWLWSRETVQNALTKGEIAFLKDRDGNWVIHTKQYLREENGEIRASKVPSIIDDVYTQNGTNEIIELFGDAQVFPFPKPTEFIKKLVQIGTNKENSDIVLDFFSGSCSTAHAILNQNIQDGGNRKFIMVQLPEPTEGTFKSIADIGKERIRRVITKIKNELMQQLNLSGSNVDLGFRINRLANSNFKSWDSEKVNDASTLGNLFNQFEFPLNQNWQPLAMKNEILLIQGFPLDSCIKTLPAFHENAVQEVTHEFCSHRLYICLDEKIADKTIDTLSIRPEDIFVCLDTALTDEAKLRLSDRCQLKVI